MCHFFMPGAYALIDYEHLQSRFRRGQIAAAGIESNLLLAGCLLWMLRACIFDPDVLILGAAANLIMAVLNCALPDGVDGMRIYSELLDCDCFLEHAEKLILW